MNALLNRWRPALVPPTPHEPAEPSAGADTRPLHGDLVLGSGARLSLAERFDGDRAQVDGELCGSLKVRQFVLGRGARMQGHVSCDSAQVRGRFEGELRVRGKLIVFASGKIEGKVRFAEVQVWKGGDISGNVMRHEDAAQRDTPPRQRGALFLPTRAVLTDDSAQG
jgi:cytoskeletal protein CcmA (bactofilin family)